MYITCRMGSVQNKKSMKILKIFLDMGKCSYSMKILLSLGIRRVVLKSTEGRARSGGHDKVDGRKRSTGNILENRGNSEGL